MSPSQPDHQQNQAEQREALAHLQGLLAKREAKNLLWYHQVGQALHALKPEGSVYGQDWVLSLVEHFEPSLTRSLAYRSLKFQACFNVEEVRQLQLWGLGWSKVMFLLRVEDPTQRWELAQQTHQQKLKARQLQQEVLRRVGCGRPVNKKMEKVPDRGPRWNLRALLRLCWRWQAHEKQLWSDERLKLLDVLGSLSQEEVAELIAEVEQTTAALKQVQQSATKLRQALQEQVRQHKS